MKTFYEQVLDNDVRTLRDGDQASLGKVESGLQNISSPFSPTLVGCLLNISALPKESEVLEILNKNPNLVMTIAEAAAQETDVKKCTDLLLILNNFLELRPDFDQDILRELVSKVTVNLAPYTSSKIDFYE